MEPLLFLIARLDRAVVDQFSIDISNSLIDAVDLVDQLASTHQLNGPVVGQCGSIVPTGSRVDLNGDALRNNIIAQ